VAITITVVLLITAFLVGQGMAWSLYVVPLLAVAIAVAYALAQRFSRSRMGMERQLYRQLLQRAKGDRRQVERLLAYERDRHPSSNRLQQLQNAIYHWDRDRR
jgi:cell division protein FtsW (lipid II flippase)